MPTELAELADAAFALGMPDHAQILVNAAYDLANGVPPDDFGDVFAELRAAATKLENVTRLTRRQRRLLGIHLSI